MIREIINFTESLNNNISTFLSDYMRPRQEGVFIVIDEEGHTNVEYYKQDELITPLLKTCIQKLQYSWTIEYDKKPYYQKCFDLPNKRIHSISPFVVAFKRTYLKEGKDFEEGKSIDKDYVLDYIKRSKQAISNDNNKVDKFINYVNREYDNIINKFVYEYENNNKKLKDNFYIILLYDTNKNLYEKSFSNYLKLRLFNSSKLGITTIEGKKLVEKEFANYEILRGWSNFYNGYNADKPFLKHKTGIMETNTITSIDAKLLYNFKEYGRMGILPNPLPIFIDNNELREGGIQNEIIKLYNIENKNSYRDVIASIFDKEKITLQKYYLLNRQGDRIVDFDFVPMFKYNMDTKIYNVTELKDSSKKTLSNVFELEKEFNNLFVKYNNTGLGVGFLIGNYFGDKIENQNSFKGHTATKETISSFYKYRKSIYDYIYKSRQQSITSDMFDDMVYSAILSDISMDEYKSEKHSKFYSIREKINLWFSLYNLFSNNLKENDMASRVTDLISKMRNVSQGETNFETPEEFAFGAGQVVSYLIDRSVATNKTYAMLEPYLQKSKSGQLQDAIAQTITIYKHDISVYKGKFERLASHVLTYNSDVEMKPLLKYFLAGSFSLCVVYEKTEK